MARGGYTYIMTNKPRGVLCIGVTADVAARAEHHRNGTGSAFCKKYRLTRLVLVDPHDDITLAIAREKALKAWKREWKSGWWKRAIQIGVICQTVSLDRLRPQPSLG